MKQNYSHIRNWFGVAIFTGATILGMANKDAVLNRESESPWEKYSLEQLLEKEGSRSLHDEEQILVRNLLKTYYSDNPEEFFYATNNITPSFPALQSSQYGEEISTTLSRIAPYTSHLEEASKKTLIPEEYLTSIIVAESTGRVNARSHANALGLMQVWPATYSDLRRQATTDIDMIRKVFSEEEISSLKEKNWVEYLFMKPEEFTSNTEGIQKFKEKYGFSDERLFKHRIPFALTVMKEYDGKIPFNSSSGIRSLYDPQTNIHVGSLILLNHSLGLHAYSAELQKDVFGDYSITNTLVFPEALSGSYNGGLGRMRNVLGTAVASSKEMYDLSTGSEFFNRIARPETTAYAPKVASIKQSLTGTSWNHELNAR